MSEGGFNVAVAGLLKREGGLTLDRRDPGNWTGGVVGKGRLGGTKYGISAAAFPTLDIESLTAAQAAAIYRHLYWDRLGLDVVPSRLAGLIFDTAVNSGCRGAVRLLQQALKVPADGVLGPHTHIDLKTHVEAFGEAWVCADFFTERLMLMASLPQWQTYRLGWTRRLFLLAFS